jgi:hypothetical protein
MDLRRWTELDAKAPNVFHEADKLLANASMAETTQSPLT